MPKTIDFKLSNTELSHIEQIIKTCKSSRLVKRATAIRMLNLGHSSYEVGRALSVSAPTVYSWFHRWKAEGLKGLEHRPKIGQPAVADKAYLQVVEETLEQDPGELGYDFTLWTIQRLNQHSSRVTGKQISDERLRLILQARGWVYRRPKEDLGALQDKEARKWAEEFLAELKKSAVQEPTFKLLFVDKTTISLRFPLRACWMQRGQQEQIRAFSVPQQSYHLMGAYHWRTDQVFSQAVENKDSQTFIQFLEYLLVECFPTRKIVLVMDNASCHHSKTVQAALSLFEPRVRVFWLPKY